MIKTGLAKLSPAQLKKLQQGKPVRVKAGTSHHVSLPAKMHKKLMKAHSQGKGMVLEGGSLFSDAKDWYVNNIPPKYREPIERLVVAGAEDAGLPVQGGSLFSDAKDWYVNNIPPKYREPIERLVVAGAEDAGLPVQGAGMKSKAKSKAKRGKGFLEDMARFPSSFINGLEMSPNAAQDYAGKFRPALSYVADHLRTGEPMRLADGRAPLSLQQWKKGDPLAMMAAGMQMPQPRLAVMPSRARSGFATPPSYRRPMSGKGKKLVKKTLRGQGWAEDLTAYDTWMNKLGDQAVAVSNFLDKDGRLWGAIKNRAIDEIDPSAKTTRLLAETAGNFLGKPSAPAAAAPAAAAAAPEEKPKRGRKKKTPVVTAEIVEEPTARPVTMPSLPPIPASYKYMDENEGRDYQPVRWMGTGMQRFQGSRPKKAAPKGPVKPHMVKGSQAARDHMAKLRAMKTKKGGALYPAGY